MRATGDSEDRCGGAWILILICLSITGCRMALGGNMGAEPWDAQVYPPAMFGSSANSPDLAIYWNCTRPDPTLVQVNGVAQNTSGNSVRFVRFELEGLDAGGKEVSGGQGSLRANVLNLNQTSSFSIQARTAGTEDRFDLHYSYKVQGFADGGSGSDGGFLVRDVCSPTQHRMHPPRP